MKFSDFILRVFALPLGMALKLFELAREGARDISNKAKHKGVLIGSGCCIDSRSKLEANCRILDGAYVLNTNVQRFTYLGRNTLVQNCSIGSFCSIANDVCIGLGGHPKKLFSTSPLFYRVKNTFNVSVIKHDYEFEEYKRIDIGNDVWVGARAIILDGVAVGDGAIVAANSVVTRSVPPYAIVAGVPARVISYRFSEKEIENLTSNQWWRWPLEAIVAKSDKILVGGE